jgi:hypothetical protein
MPTYLNNWNPRKWDWKDNNAASQRTRTGHTFKMQWSSGGTKVIAPGDRIFLGKQGEESARRGELRGVIASGTAVSEVFEDKHWGRKGTTTYNLIEFDTILTPELVLARRQVSKGPLSSIRWGIMKNGTRIDDAAAVLLEQRWAEYLDEIGFGSVVTRLRRYPKFRPFQADPRKRKAVEDAAVQEVMRHFKSLGYEIRDRQRENVGWDLEAFRGPETVLLEVKGISGSAINCELTPNEFSNMNGRRSQYAICVVVEALRDGRALSIFRFSADTGNWTDARGQVLSIVEATGARLSAL